MTAKIHKTKPAETDFCIFNDTSELPMCEEPLYLGEGFAGVCTRGSAIIEVFSTPYRVAKDDLVVILPLQLVSMREPTEDFAMTFFKVSKDLFLDVMSGLYRLTPDFFFYMRKRFRYQLSSTEAERFLHFCGLIQYRVTDDPTLFRKETILHLLRIFYWDMYVNFKKDPDAAKAFRFNTKEKVAFRFSMLVMEYHHISREVAFYADKLCISPKYLTMIMQEVNGQSARDCIAEYVVLEMKALLRNANLEIKDLVRQTGFPNQSALSCFFRKHTGMSPSEYRDSIHIL